MGQKIEVFVREVRNSPITAGHIFFVYTKDDGSPAEAVSLSPKNGFLGMEGGTAKVNDAPWNDTHYDWPKPGENPAVSMGTIVGDDLSANWGAIVGTYTSSAIEVPC